MSKQPFGKCMISIQNEQDFNRVQMAATSLGYDFFMAWEYISCAQTLFLNPFADAEWSHRPAADYAGGRYTHISIEQLEELIK